GGEVVGGICVPSQMNADFGVKVIERRSITDIVIESTGDPLDAGIRRGLYGTLRAHQDQDFVNTLTQQVEQTPANETGSPRQKDFHAAQLGGSYVGTKSGSAASSGDRLASGSGH